MEPLNKHQKGVSYQRIVRLPKTRASSLPQSCSHLACPSPSPTRPDWTRLQLLHKVCLLPPVLLFLGQWVYESVHMGFFCLRKIPSFSFRSHPSSNVALVNVIIVPLPSKCFLPRHAVFKCLAIHIQIDFRMCWVTEASLRLPRLVDTVADLLKLRAALENLAVDRAAGSRTALGGESIVGMGFLMPTSRQVELGWMASCHEEKTALSPQKVVADFEDDHADGMPRPWDQRGLRFRDICRGNG